ncbi:hypothetical protein ACFYRN_40725 [Streptomyces sp. NPDC005227]|jgi:hypothetical protein|uniref:hypothetical protein n=1 Tax=unclassified Streptomyces TaxID=2593676 RepID=UPI0036877806
MKTVREILEVRDNQKALSCRRDDDMVGEKFLNSARHRRQRDARSNAISAQFGSAVP